MADIFLSYAREDLVAAQSIAETLQAFGWSVFWDRRIPHGEEYRAVIEQQLAAAGCVVVLWSHASITSPWVIDESNEALERRRLVPVLIEGVKPPFGFRQLQAADLTSGAQALRQQQLEHLQDSIRAKLSPAAPPLDHENREVGRRPGRVASPSAASESRGALAASIPTVRSEAIGAATVTTLLGGFAGPIALHASTNRALLLWSMASVCAGLIIGKQGTAASSVLRASILPGIGHATGALGTVFFVWASTQLSSNGPMALNIPLGRSGAGIDLGNPYTIPVILLLSLVTSVGSWMLIGAVAVGSGVLLPTMAREDPSRLRGLDTLRKWAAVVAAAVAATVAIVSALAP